MKHRVRALISFKISQASRHPSNSQEAETLPARMHYFTASRAGQDGEILMRA
jgi:hypothetical protein